ncbi:alpha/beta hydrolase [Mycolicibacterium poriferae]|uniref:alpha/beta hydrolase n=1 Tax=Mycolicibacterium poriferae TaxID=39694 RepID=UPI0024B8B7E1|nr:alpha/beta hydrolase [Mycolicibacterium poriferae]
MTDVVFIHGLWVAHSAWQPWIDHFAAQGIRAIAPPWPGEDPTPAPSRENGQAQAGFGLAEVTNHFAAILGELDRSPVVVGHSFGGLIAQKLLAQRLVSAAVAINPAPIKGVRALPIPQLRSAFPVLRNPANRGKAKALTRSQWRYGFGNALSPQESDSLWEQWSIPSPCKPLFEISVANFAPKSPAKVDVTDTERGPLLITGGTADHTVPLATAKGAYRRYRKTFGITDFHGFDGRGHSLTIDHGWRDVADVALAWLGRRAVV